ncbi:MAG: hypothetical protein ISS78_09415 [Phycisphaerae bacterium]|nr:hypothetical protein [Phycisphaerae bacterium]
MKRLPVVIAVVIFFACVLSLPQWARSAECRSSKSRGSSAYRGRSSKYHRAHAAKARSGYSHGKCPSARPSPHRSGRPSFGARSSRSDSQRGERIRRFFERIRQYRAAKMRSRTGHSQYRGYRGRGHYRPSAKSSGSVSQRGERIRRFFEGMRQRREAMMRARSGHSRYRGYRGRGYHRPSDRPSGHPRSGAKPSDQDLKRFREGVEKMWRHVAQRIKEARERAEREKSGKKGPPRRPERRREEVRRPQPRRSGEDLERRARGLAEMERRLHERCRELNGLAERLKRRERELNRLAEQLKERREAPRRRSSRERDRD